MSTLPWEVPINEFLGSLSHTGQTGFEGLVADLCEAATGQRFRLSGSGPQEGQDSRSEPGYGNRIKVEAKHYAKSTLHLRELTAEIVQATVSNAGVDLWVLAASCAVPDQHAATLEALARKENIEIVLLDLGNDGLPRLVVLMAAFPERVQDWIRRNGLSSPVADLGDALNNLSTEPTFTSARNQLLQKFRSTLLGYDDARERAKQAFLQVMGDQGSALAQFNQRVAIRSGEVHKVRRVALLDQLSSWWTNTRQGQKRAVVIGEEGTGKTWAVFDWVADRTEAGEMPIVLPFSAVAESIPDGESIEGFLPKLLVKWTRTSDVASWAGRINRWLATPANSEPLILLLVDGLSERPTVQWPLFFRTLDDERWRKRIAVLATDRARHWNASCAAAGLDGFQEIPVGGYTDWELDQALEGKSIGLSEIPYELHPLIRKPRYCELVCEHFGEMKDSGDFTLERLILLDAKHRSELKRGAMTQDEFIEILRNLATHYRESPTVRLSSLDTVVPFSDPGRRIHEEILNGGILVAKPGVGAGFTVEHTRLVFGLGMLLCDELREAAERGANRGQIENHLERWFEPHPEMDLKVEICGAALFHSLIEHVYPTASRRELLRYWLGLRNWGDSVQEAFTDYVRRCPEDFIAVVEEFWTSTRDLGAAQDFFRAAFTKHRDDPAVQSFLVAAVSRWMGFVHPAGHPILRQDAAHEDRQRHQIEARIGHPLQAGPLDLCGAHLTIVNDDAQLRLSRFGFLIISAGPRLPFLPALIHWAIASAVMGYAMEASVADWVVRLSNEDFAPQLVDGAEKLLASHDPLARVAAHTLLSRLDTVTARNLRHENPLPENEYWNRLREEHAKDPCLSGFEWSDEDCSRCIQREDVPVHVILDRVGDHVFDPDYPFPDSLVQRATAVLAIEPANYRAGLSQTAEAHWLEQALPLLAARSPRSLADFIRKIVATLPSRSLERLYPAAIWLPEISLVFGDSELLLVRQVHERLVQVIANTSTGNQTESAKNNWIVTEALVFLAELPHLSPAAVFSELHERPPSALDLIRFEPWFGLLPTDQVTTGLNSLHSATDDASLVRTLWFLSASKVSLSDADRNRIIELTESRDDKVRGAAMRFVSSQEDDDLGRRAVDLGHSYRESPHTYEARWGTRALIQYGDRLPFDALASRLHPSDTGYAVIHRGSRTDELRLYGLSLDELLHRILGAPYPEVPNLPAVIVAPEEDNHRTTFLKIKENAEPGSIYKNPSTTWTAGRPGAGPAQLFSAHDMSADELTRKFQQRAEAIASAWRTEALQWFGLRFSRTVMHDLYRHDPSMVRRWTEPVLRDGPVARIIRVRLASFLAALSPCLLEEDPVLGIKLWNALRLKSDGPAFFDAATCAFTASQNNWTDEARWQILNECHDDAAISDVAYIAERTGRNDWLHAATEKLIAEPRLWRRALGLTLASFSDITLPQFERYAANASVSDTWVDEQLEWLRGNVQRNCFAQHWFRTFLGSDDSDTSWGALQLMHRCGDRRFFLWRGRLEDGFGGNARAERRIRFLCSMDHDLEQKLDREKQRKDSLFGIKTERGEVFPFFSL